MECRYSVYDLAEIVGGLVRGDGDVMISGIAQATEAGDSDIIFLSDDRYADLIDKSQAAAVLVRAGFRETPMSAILCEHMPSAVAKLFAAFKASQSCPAPSVHHAANVHESAKLGCDVAIGPHVVVEEDVRIGDRCKLHAGVFIGRGSVIGDDCEFWPGAVLLDGCEIGHRVIIHANAVIGADGFGYYFQDGRHNKIPHAGNVRLGDDVEIGACTCVDRSKFGSTHIGQGTKIDNLVQVAHNVHIGEHSVFPAFCAISGSVRFGDYVVCGGGAGFVDGVTIGDRVRIAGGRTVVTKDIADGATVSGAPASDHSEMLREQAMVKRLPKLMEQLKTLAARVEELEASMHDRS